MHAQVRPLGQELAQQAIGVLTTTSLPGTVRVTEVNPHTSGLVQLSMARHLLALVAGVCLAHGLYHLVELGCEGRQGALGRCICILHSSTRRVLRSTSTLTADWLLAPLIKSPSQCPGISRSSTSGGRTWMLTISGIWPRRS